MQIIKDTANQLTTKVAGIIGKAFLSSVHCTIMIPACEDGDVRLRGGSHYREGRVEICRNQQWGRVCDDYWDGRDSAVVCRQLGFSEEGISYNSQCTNEIDCMIFYVSNNLKMLKQ